MVNDDHPQDSLLESLRRWTGQVAGGTFELARTTATMTAMFGETWLRSTVLNHLEPERMEAMREAGSFLRDTRETAGLSIRELSESLGLKDKQVLEDVEHGKTIMPLETMLRSASLLARHDPIPFLIKFMRTYNPALEKTLEQLGMMALPRQYERERRFINLYRQHDTLRSLSDAEFERYIDYMEQSGNMVVDLMGREKAAYATSPSSRSTEEKARGAEPKPRTTGTRKKATRKAAGTTPPKRAAGKSRTTKPKKPAAPNPKKA